MTDHDDDDDDELSQRLQALRGKLSPAAPTRLLPTQDCGDSTSTTKSPKQFHLEPKDTPIFITCRGQESAIDVTAADEDADLVSQLAQAMAETGNDDRSKDLTAEDFYAVRPVLDKPSRGDSEGKGEARDDDEGISSLLSRFASLRSGIESDLPPPEPFLAICPPRPPTPPEAGADPYNLADSGSETEIEAEDEAEADRISSAAMDFLSLSSSDATSLGFPSVPTSDPSTIEVGVKAVHPTLGPEHNDIPAGTDLEPFRRLVSREMDVKRLGEVGQEIPRGGGDKKQPFSAPTKRDFLKSHFGHSASSKSSSSSSASRLHLPSPPRDHSAGLEPEDEDAEAGPEPCILCASSATLSCFSPLDPLDGCAGDLYCSECWVEGHGTMQRDELKEHRTREVNANGRGLGRRGRGGGDGAADGRGRGRGRRAMAA